MSEHGSSGGRGGTVTLPRDPATDGDRATGFFATEARLIPGVTRVATGVPTEPGRERIDVYLTPGDEEAEEAVYLLKGRIYDLFAGVRLEVWVRDDVGASRLI
jgi:hypothetical protein